MGSSLQYEGRKMEKRSKYRCYYISALIVGLWWYDVAASPKDRMSSSDIISQIEHNKEITQEQLSYLMQHVIETEDTQTLRLLKAKGIDYTHEFVYCPGSMGNEIPFLFHVALARNPAFVEACIEDYPTLTDLRDETGQTLLHYAAYLGSSEIPKQLIDKTDLYAQTNNGDLPLHCAVRSGNVAGLASLMKWYPVDFIEQHEDTLKSLLEAKVRKHDESSYLLWPSSDEEEDDEQLSVESREPSVLDLDELQGRELMLGMIAGNVQWPTCFSEQCEAIGYILKYHADIARVFNAKQECKDV